MFYHDDGQEEECKKWITNGAQLRDPYCMAQKAVYICKYLEESCPIARYTKAIYFMTQAAEAGHIISMYRLAKIFYGWEPGVRRSRKDTLGQLFIPASGHDRHQAKYWLDKLVSQLSLCGFDLYAWDPQAKGTGMQRSEVATDWNVGDVDPDWVKFILWDKDKDEDEDSDFV